MLRVRLGYAKIPLEASRFALVFEAGLPSRSERPGAMAAKARMRPREIPSSGFEPRIVGFVCNWGAYSGIEVAGDRRIEYPANVHLIRVMCLGRVHHGLVLRAFEMGADGVILLGCPSGQCRYRSGIEQTKGMVAQVKRMLNMLGVGSKRIHLVEVPAGDGEFAARRIAAFVKRTQEMGPSPVKYVPKQAELAHERIPLLETDLKSYSFPTAAPAEQAR